MRAQYLRNPVFSHQQSAAGSERRLLQPRLRVHDDLARHLDHGIDDRLLGFTRAPKIGADPDDPCVRRLGREEVPDLPRGPVVDLGTVEQGDQKIGTVEPGLAAPEDLRASPDPQVGDLIGRDQLVGPNDLDGLAPSGRLLKQEAFGLAVPVAFGFGEERSCQVDDAHDRPSVSRVFVLARRAGLTPRVPSPTPPSASSGPRSCTPSVAASRTPTVDPRTAGSRARTCG
jgi:hypothetical protein